MRKAWVLIVLLVSAVAARAEGVTIAALGDSLTQGYGLVQEDGFVPQLQRWLDARQVDVTLINAGVSGDTTAGGAARVAWTLTPDVDAMIVALGGNDLLRGVDPETSRANIEAILRTAQAQGVEVLLVGIEAPNNYGPDYKAAFDAIYPELSKAYGTLYLASFFVGLGEAADNPAMLGDVMQSDGIHPNAAGVARIVEGIGPSVLDLITRTGEG
ncbi:arylesterase [Aestuariivita sp.]|jgi:acyl-CoA thioesterase-1|uniref:arylesterase n=1 Tax=Aestuariivita sp. TaxID=1872407 RepID=UPI00216D6C06|nr:arylesterase [Aestuariivita sp.]MCE8008398.1 arylesterase [Aestuariivita sp.]